MKWELCRPELARMVEEFEESTHTYTGDTSSDPKKHHEDSFPYQNKFYNDVQNEFDGMMANPFKLDHLTAVNNIKIRTPGASRHIKLGCNWANAI